MIQDLHLSNFRGFTDLQLTGLGQVNLIVGPNNSGKTSLLEAIYLSNKNVPDLGNSSHLFRSGEGQYGWDYVKKVISIAESKSIITTRSLKGENRLVISNTTVPELSPTPGMRFNGGWASNSKSSFETLKVISITRKQSDEVVESFARAVRPARGERIMESLLNKVDSRIKSVRLDYSNKALIAVDIGLEERIPLSMVGEGINRVLTIFSELLGDNAELCLIDEVENGIHYLALVDVWKGLAEIAVDRKIQIFATTHSGECLEAAHHAFATRESYDLRVVQLYPHEGRLDGRVLGREEIELSLDRNLDLR